MEYSCSMPATPAAKEQQNSGDADVVFQGWFAKCRCVACGMWGRALAEAFNSIHTGFAKLPQQQLSWADYLQWMTRDACCVHLQGLWLHDSPREAYQRGRCALLPKVSTLAGHTSLHLQPSQPGREVHVCACSICRDCCWRCCLLQSLTLLQYQHDKAQRSCKRSCHNCKAVPDPPAGVVVQVPAHPCHGLPSDAAEDGRHPAVCACCMVQCGPLSGLAAVTAAHSEWPSCPTSSSMLVVVLHGAASQRLSTQLSTHERTTTCPSLHCAAPHCAANHCAGLWSCALTSAHSVDIAPQHRYWRESSAFACDGRSVAGWAFRAGVICTHWMYVPAVAEMPVVDKALCCCRHCSST